MFSYIKHAMARKLAITRYNSSDPCIYRGFYNTQVAQVAQHLD